MGVLLKLGMHLLYLSVQLQRGGPVSWTRPVVLLVWIGYLIGMFGGHLRYGNRRSSCGLRRSSARQSSVPMGDAVNITQSSVHLRVKITSMQPLQPRFQLRGNCFSIQVILLSEHVQDHLSPLHRLTNQVLIRLRHALGRESVFFHEPVDGHHEFVVGERSQPPFVEEAHNVHCRECWRNTNILKQLLGVRLNHSCLDLFQPDGATRSRGK
mmetsp:Transcript_26768/g.69285  ORF Transcript_26768/g.69285 Transcript_26768/m.69285 type:complete len:211 (-) Transcript_26768:1871-2503(-)